MAEFDWENMDHSARRAANEQMRAERGPLTFEQQAALKPEERQHSFDTKRVHYIDSDVYTEAKARIAHCLRTFDKVFVSYSGGKDSHVVLYLTRMVMDEMGLQDQPLDVVFQDEELIPDDVIEHVASLRNDPRFTLHYVAVPLTSKFFCLGESIPYIQWDNDRQWIRQKPDYAITHLHPEDKPLTQGTVLPYLAARLGWKGTLCMLNGIRAQESLQRFQSCTLIKNKYNYIMSDAVLKNVSLAKPIFDWTTDDIFRFFYDTGIKYCRIYDNEMLAGTNPKELRVSTPLHERAYNYLCRLRVMYPVMFEQLAATFPGLVTHVRYWKDFDRMGIIYRYPKSFAGILQYINENIKDPKNRALAMKAVTNARAAREKNKRTGKLSDEKAGGCYGYPLLHIFQILVRGTYMTGAIPVHSNPDPAMRAYEEEANQK